MGPFTVAESIRDLRGPYPSASRLLHAAAGGEEARLALVQLWMTEGIPHAFEDCPGVYASMRTWLGTKLAVHPKEISMTGSGRLGESWAPKKLGRPFTRDSDLDLFVVSADFFAQIKREFECWKTDYDEGVVTPQNRQQAVYWRSNRRYGPRNIHSGFIDARKIPPWDRYATAQYVTDMMWRTGEKLKVTLGAPVVREVSVRAYRDMKSLADQQSLNLDTCLRRDVAS